jgi:phosphinothricin acetyltransferase
MLTYFITPDAVGKGFGTRILGQLTDDARKAGMKALVANRSSKNEAGIHFPKRHEFEEAGNLAGVGEKFGNPFDILWMQRAVD